MKEIKEYIRTVTTKGQVTIPAEVRRILALEPGDQTDLYSYDRYFDRIPGVVRLEP